MNETMASYRWIPYSDEAITQASQLLVDKAGFVVITGVPVDPYDLDKTKELAVNLMSAFGSLAPQDEDGTVAYLLRDEGVEVQYGHRGGRRAQPGVRSSKSNDRIRLHNDSGARWASDVVDVLGTLMVSDGTSGGDVSIVDGHAVYKQMKQQNPEAVQCLRRPFAFDTATRPGRDGLPFSWGPVFYDYQDHFELRVSLARIEMAADFLGTPLSDEQTAAIDALEAALLAPDLLTTFHMRPGDFLLIDDRRMVHSRDEFQDGPDLENQRCLIRLWAQTNTVVAAH